MVPGLLERALFPSRASRTLSSIRVLEGVPVVGGLVVESALLLSKPKVSILLERASSAEMFGEPGELGRGCLNKALATGFWDVSSWPLSSSSGAPGLACLTPGVGERP